MRTAIDTNIISALWSNEPSCQQVLPLLEQAHREGALVICGAVYAELLAHPRSSRKFVDQFLRDTSTAVEFDVDEDIWRDAGFRFAAYANRRRSEGGPRRLLADFIVGSHARLRADRLVTLDFGRYRTDYPDLKVLE